ncbi:MAG: hypothetical protein NVS3B7_06440 [Candidatus Elarobacter sp.]
MRRSLLAPIAALGLLAASPSPDAVSAPTLTVVCDVAPFFVFVPGSDRPARARTPDARLGERFGLVSGPRTTLAGTQYFETDVTVVEPGPPGAHYWIGRDCAIPAK